VSLIASLAEYKQFGTKSVCKGPSYSIPTSLVPSAQKNFGVVKGYHWCLFIWNRCF